MHDVEVDVQGQEKHRLCSQRLAFKVLFIGYVATVISFIPFVHLVKGQNTCREGKAEREGYFSD